MKKILLLLLFTFTFSQNEQVQVQWKSNGIGFDFHMLPSQVLMLSAGEASGALLGVYFPFVSQGGLMFEPNITYANTYEERDYYSNDLQIDDYTQSSTIWSITVGIFKTWRSENINSYAGIRVGKMWMEVDNDPGNDDDSDAFIWGPAIGAEWFVNQSFSFGGEAMFTKITTEEDSDSNGWGYPEYTQTNQINMLIPKFIVRYYF